MEYEEAMDVARGFAKQHPEYENPEIKALAIDLLEYIGKYYTLTPKEQ